MEKPLSIIIPTLNEEKNITLLIKNLGQQTYKNFEVIIVDSNSKDKTLINTKRFSKRLKIKTYQLGFTKGPSYGRNKGATLAKNEELLFLDADTILPKDFLAKMIEKKEKRKIDVAAFYFKSSPKTKLIVKIGYVLNNLGLFLTQLIRPMATGACITSKKSIHKKIKGFNVKIKLCEDCEYVRRASKVSKFRVIPISYFFNERRIKKEGPLKLQIKYLKEHFLSIFRNAEKQNVEYEFGKC